MKEGLITFKIRPSFAVSREFATRSQTLQGNARPPGAQIKQKQPDFMRNQAVIGPSGAI